MRSFIKLLCFILLLCPFTASAHGYWLETEGSHKAGQVLTIKMFYGEFSAGERESGDKLDKMKDIKVFVTDKGGNKQEVTMKQTPDYWEGSFTPLTDGTYEITGINDVREVQDWTKHNLGIVRPIQYLKAYYTVGDKEKQKASLVLDVTVKNEGEGKYQVAVTENGKPVAAQKVAVAGFGGQELELVTDKKGKVSFTLKKPGLHLISVQKVDKTPGQYKGKDYASVRHQLDASLYY